MYSLLATCPRGLEGLLAEELASLGARIGRERPGGLSIEVDLPALYACALGSRLANRLLLPLGEAPVHSADAFYEAVTALPWSSHFPVDASFAVDFSGTGAAFRNSQFGAQRTKDAIVDHFRRQDGQRPSVDLQAPAWRARVRLGKQHAEVAIDLVGDSLHRRGYRLEGGAAPLKENLAAALLLRAGWPALAARGAALIDPMCGSGTLLIEGAMMAMGIAPGCARGVWSFEHWRHHDAALWAQQRQRALAQRDAALARQWPEIRGYDALPSAVRVAEANIARAGLEGRVRVMTKPLERLVRPTHDALPLGLLITNPPYGERLGDDATLPGLYRLLGERLRSEFVGWQAAVFTGNPELGKTMGLRSHKRYRLLNGTLPAQLLLFDVRPESFVNTRRPPLGGDTAAEVPAEPLTPGAQMFANRLRKNHKRLKAWLQREGVSCYRLYDADMPEYAVAVDCYGDRVHVAEYAAPSKVDAAAAARRLDEVMAAIPEALAIAPAQVVLKQRRRQRGSEQYQRQARSEQWLPVREGAATLLVNLQDYLDTGLFLDHRPVRRWIGEWAAGARFLNLFCYTATATVHAGLGGARESTSVDLSRTYLDWAERNLAANGLDPRRHRLVRADVREWLQQAGRDTRERYDLILLDPPTFSNSKRMDGVLDTQRDHVALIEAAMAVLNPGGRLIFSTNYRRFQLDEAALAAFQIEDVTRASLDPDFEHSAGIHRCWVLRHPPQASPWDTVSLRRRG